MVGPEESAHLCVGAELGSPFGLDRSQMIDDDLVGIGLRVFGMEPDLQGNFVISPDQLSFVMLAGGVAEPDLHAPAMCVRAERAVIVVDEPLDRVEHLLEERSLQHLGRQLIIPTADVGRSCARRRRSSIIAWKYSSQSGWACPETLSY